MVCFLIYFLSLLLFSYTCPHFPPIPLPCPAQPPPLQVYLIEVILILSFYLDSQVLEQRGTLEVSPLASCIVITMEQTQWCKWHKYCC